jgi:DNA-binding transcriptional LysR family regulator
MEGGSYDVTRWLESDQADFGFLSSLQIHGLDWIPFCEDPLLAVVPKDYPAPEGGVFPISNFEKKDFIISEEGIDYDIHRALKISDVSPNISFSSKDDFAIISMVKNRLGVSILPKLHLRGTENVVSTYPLDPPFSRTLGIAMKSKDALSPAARRFIKLTEELLPSLQED